MSELTAKVDASPHTHPSAGFSFSRTRAPKAYHGHQRQSEISPKGDLPHKLSIPETLANLDIPVGRLPIELFLSLVRNCQPEIDHRLALTHVCRRWRLILVSTPSFWTNVHLERARDASISLLEMQLGRAKDLPLDVEWILQAMPLYNGRIVELCRQKAPFARWRTLTLSTVHSGYIQVPKSLPNGIFTGLESVVIYPHVYGPLLDAISTTTTSKLRTLNLVTPPPLKLASEVRFKVLQTRVSRLILTGGEIHAGDTVVLPRNIVDLETKKCCESTFPHLLRFKASTCIFQATHKTDLRNLTSLIVTNLLEVQAGCAVLLPSLQHLTVATITLGDGACLEAPLLESLRLQRTPLIGALEMQRNVASMLWHPGYLLSSGVSLEVATCLPTNTLSSLLDRSPRIQRLKLCFDDEFQSEDVMDRIFGSTSLTEQPEKLGNSTQGLCPRLEELRLNFLWASSYVQFWKERAAQIVRTRQPFGVVPAIYASWEGEGSYRRLG